MTELRQRQPRVECEGYLTFIRNFPCCVCNMRQPSEAAHVKLACPTLGKRAVGMAEKPDDKWSVPLCSGCHRTDNDAQHAGSEESFWIRTGKYPLQLAADLYARYLAQGGKPGEVKQRKVKKAKKRERAPRPKRTGPKQKIPSKPFPKTQRGFGK